MSRPGFTLIELLVAASLFLIAVATFGHLLKVGATTVDSASRLNHAVYVLQAKAEEIRTLPFNQLLYLDGSVFAQGTGKVAATTVLADLVSIQLELEWDPKKVPLKLHALRSKY